MICFNSSFKIKKIIEGKTFLNDFDCDIMTRNIGSDLSGETKRLTVWILKFKFSSSFFNSLFHISRGIPLGCVFRVRSVRSLKDWKSVFKAKNVFWMSLKCRMSDV